MKFKRTLALTLATIFSLTLMGSSAPKTFAEGTPEIKTEKKLDSKTQEAINQEVKKLDEQGKLDKLKEKVKKKKTWSFKNGINNVKKNFSKIIAYSFSWAIPSTLLSPVSNKAYDEYPILAYSVHYTLTALSTAVFLSIYHFIMQ